MWVEGLGGLLQLFPFNSIVSLIIVISMATAISILTMITIATVITLVAISGHHCHCTASAVDRLLEVELGGP